MDIEAIPASTFTQSLSARSFLTITTKQGASQVTTFLTPCLSLLSIKCFLKSSSGKESNITFSSLSNFSLFVTTTKSFP